jgi:hypothetical protein
MHTTGPGELVSADREISCPSARTSMSAHRDYPMSAVTIAGSCELESLTK